MSIMQSQMGLMGLMGLIGLLGVGWLVLGVGECFFMLYYKKVVSLYFKVKMNFMSKYNSIKTLAIVMMVLTVGGGAYVQAEPKPKTVKE